MNALRNVVDRFLQTGLVLSFLAFVAPYVGVTWIRQLGQTADLSRAAGSPVDDLRFVLGLRLWW